MAPKPQSLRRIRLLPALLLATVLAWTAGAAAAEPVLTLGRISDDPKNHYVQLKPLLDYIVPRMADLGIREGRILMARDLRQMTNHLRHGRVDWVTETSGMAVQLQGIADARPLVLTERGGVRAYRSFIIARRGGEVRSLTDLAGRGIAFEHAASTSAYLAPAAELLASGLRLQPLMDLADAPTDGAVGYLFARSESNIAMWVDKGLIASGAVSNLGWNDTRAIPETVRARLAVVHESTSLPRALELVRSGLDVRVTTRLRQLLLAASSDPQAAVALRAFFNTTAFLPIDAEVERQLSGLRAGMTRVRMEVE